MPNAALKPPFPYFGNKMRIAQTVWDAFGDPDHYVEPFAGSLAVLLARPNHHDRLETVNELNPYISNFWRAVRADPDGVAALADDAVHETDLTARHHWLMKQTAFKEKMLADPEYHDTKIAAWWLWGLSAWIGQGWCVSKTPGAQMPHLGDGGKGVNRRTVTDLKKDMQTLQKRLRHVRVLCGDWTRTLSPSITHKNGVTANPMTAIFLDPPYITSGGIYGKANPVAQDVLDWCKKHWEHQRLRIALCGYEGDLDVPQNWRCVSWKQPKGYQTSDNQTGRLERIWFSPACIQSATHQTRMF